MKEKRYSLLLKPFRFSTRVIVARSNCMEITIRLLPLKGSRSRSTNSFLGQGKSVYEAFVTRPTTTSCNAQPENRNGLSKRERQMTLLLHECNEIQGRSLLLWKEGAQEMASSKWHYKLVLLGEAGVGKSTLVVRFVKGKFIENQESTIGAAFLTQTVILNDVTVKFEIWGKPLL